MTAKRLFLLSLKVKNFRKRENNKVKFRPTITPILRVEEDRPDREDGKELLTQEYLEKM